MFRTSAKKVLAVFMALTLLMSCLMVYGINVFAKETEIECTFTSGAASYYNDAVYQGKHSNMTVASDFSDKYGVSINTTDDGANGTKGFMRMEYKEGSSGDNFKIGFRFTDNNGGKFNAVVGKNYTVSFDYKVLGMPEGGSAKIGIFNGSQPWGQSGWTVYTTAATLTEVNTEWQHAEVDFTGTAENGIHLGLYPDDSTKQEGLIVLVDNTKVENQNVKISFIVNGGSSVGAVNGIPGQPITYPEAPTKDGFLFNGWKTQNGDPAPTVFPEDNIALVAQWIVGHKVTFESNGGSEVAPTMGEPTDPIQWPANPTRGGYIFAGWITSDGSPLPTVYDKDYTLVAKWDPSPSAVKVEFNAMGGTELGAIYGEPNTALPTILTEKNGYDFLGWFKDYSCTAKATVFPTADAVYYAGWQKEGLVAQDFESLNPSAGSATYLTSGFETSGSVATDDDGVMGAYFRATVEDNTNGANTFSEGKGAFAKYMPEYGAGARTGTGVMQLTFTNEASDLAAAFSLPKITAAQSFPAPVANTAYRVNFWYKAVKLTGDTTLKVVNTGHNLAGETDPNGATSNTIQLSPDTTPIGEWVKASLVVTPTDTKYFYIVAKGIKGSREGTEILIDDVEICNGNYVQVTSAGNANQVTTNTSTSYANSGSKSVKVIAQKSSITDPLKTSRFIYADKNGNLPLTTGKKYTISFWLRRTGKIKMRVFSEGDIEKNLGNDSELLLEKDFPAASGWAYVKETFTLPGDGKTTKYVSLGFASGTNANTNQYVDDLLIEPYEADTSMPQDYELFDAQKFENTPVADDGNIHGTPDALEVVDTVNHTLGGSKALKLTMKSEAEDAYTRAVMTAYKGGDLKLPKGTSYLLTFYAYSATDRTVTFAVGNNENVDLSSANKKDLNSKSSLNTVDLKAGEWRMVSIKFRAGQERYFTLGAWFDGASALNTADVFVDDVVFRKATDYEPTEGLQPYETLDLGVDISPEGAGDKAEVSLGANNTLDGCQSLKITNNSWNPLDRTQINITNGDNEAIKVEQGKNYRLYFYVFVPATENVKTVQYWLTVGAESDPAITDQVTLDAKKVAEGEKYIEKGTWTRLTAEVKECPLSGNLRLGITLGTYEASTMYLDDVSVKEFTEFVMDPNSTYQTFATYDLDDNSMALRNANKTCVSGDYDHTGDGKSLRCTTVTWAGADRNQWVLTNPNKGNEKYEFRVGEAYTIKFWVYFPDEYGASMNFNYWIMSCDNPTSTTVSAGADKNAAEYDLGSGTMPVNAGEWVEFSNTIVIKNGKYLMFGTSDNTSIKANSVYYIDDVSVSEPRFVNLTYDANGGVDGETMGAWDLNKYTFEVPYLAKIDSAKFQPAFDPYMENYEFTGWYRDKGCEVPFRFSEEAVDEENMVLYAGWKKSIESKKIERDWCGPKAYWTYDSVTNQLSISGEGPMDDYTLGTQPWANYLTTATSILVDNGITSIGNYAFASCTAAKTISIANTVTRIGAHAFDGSAIEEIFVPDSVTDIDKDAFAGCNANIIYENPEMNYEIVMVKERVYTGAGDNEERFIAGGTRPLMEEADAVSASTEKKTKKKTATDDGIPAWLIIVIAGAAVVVIGGGATLFVILRKKSSNKKEVEE